MDEGRPGIPIQWEIIGQASGKTLLDGTGLFTPEIKEVE
jgi:hypothetical protein